MLFGNTDSPYLTRGSGLRCPSLRIRGTGEPPEGMYALMALQERPRQGAEVPPGNLLRDEEEVTDGLYSLELAIDLLLQRAVSVLRYPPELPALVGVELSLDQPERTQRQKYPDDRHEPCGNGVLRSGRKGPRIEQLKDRSHLTGNPNRTRALISS